MQSIGGKSEKKEWTGKIDKSSLSLSLSEEKKALSF